MIARLSLLSLSLASLVSSSALAAPCAEWMFERLTAHPEFKTDLHAEQAQILKRGETYLAAFAVVSSEKHPLTCVYAAPFHPSIGAEPGTYLLKPRYICDASSRLKPYEGLFEVKYPECAAEVCANPAIGVGNLLVLPTVDLDLGRLPLELPVKIDGRIQYGYDPGLPIAGG